jgi:uncharacterized Zn-finger protein
MIKMIKNTTPIEVGTSDLPLHCPMNQTPVWNLHPKVFLDIGHTGEAKCPYCGTSYRLKAGVKVGH